MPGLLDDPTLSATAEQLQALEAEEAKLAPAPQPESTEDTATTTGDRGAGTKETEQVQSPESKPDAGTPAAKEPQKTEQNTAPKETKYTQAQKSEERKNRTWAEVNAEKDRIRAEADKIKAEREAFAKERAEFESQKQAASKPKYTPEQVEAKAADWERFAAHHEKNGDFEKADYGRFKAKELLEYAKELRANPPKTTEQQSAEAKAAEEKLQSDQKEWWAKAAQDFPDSAKEGTEVAKTIKALITPPGKPGHDATLFNKDLSDAALNTPRGLYYLARMVNAETVAAKVPSLEKDNGELRAKVKELAGKMAVSMDGAATTHDTKPYGQQTESEQEESLRRELAGQEATYTYQ